MTNKMLLLLIGSLLAGSLAQPLWAQTQKNPGAAAIGGQPVTKSPKSHVNFRPASEWTRTSSDCQQLNLRVTAQSPTEHQRPDGQIRVVPAGGQPPYRYYLSEARAAGYNQMSAQASFDGLTAGSYLVVLEDSRGCVVSQSIELIPNP